MEANTKKLESSFPLVSVVMITHNRARFIGDAIKSVINQTYTTWELIIIDSASTDDTERIVRSFNDTRIRYFKSHNNPGISISRNRATNEARGTYIAVLDSDDIWNDKNKIRNQVFFLERHSNCGVLGSNINLINEQGKKIGSDTYGTTDTEIRKTILRRNQFAHSSVMMRTSAIEQAGGYPTQDLAEDYALFLEIGRNWKLANLQEYTTSYRKHTYSESSQKRQRMAVVIFKTVQKHTRNYPNSVIGILKSFARILVALVV